MHTLPRLTQVGSCVLLTFTHYDAIRLFVEEMSDRAIAGFDLVSGHRKTLKITGDSQIIGEHGWPAVQVRLLTETEVRLYLQERPGEMRAQSGTLQRQANALLLTSERYLEEIPDILRNLKAPRAVA